MLFDTDNSFIKIIKNLEQACIVWKEYIYLFSEFFHSESKSNLYITIQNHQNLINKMLEYEVEENIYAITVSQLARDLDCSNSLINKRITKINTEDICIQKKANGIYIIYYKDLSERGIFSKLLSMTKDTEELINQLQNESNFIKVCEILSACKLSYKEIMTKYNVGLKTVQTFMAYIHNWKNYYLNHASQEHIKFIEEISNSTTKSADQ